MEISSAKYYKDIATDTNTSIKVVIDGKTWSVPIDTANRHYQAIQDWVADGNTIAEAD
tara:strand:+ start:2141 stop:2314 length:174 start_codon:yes stop_codon:yes gene_type:complete